MNYAIESMDMSDFCRLYSDKYKKNYKVENPGTENRCSGITELLITYHFHQIHNSVKLSCLCRTFPHFQNFYDSGDLIRAEI